MTAPLASTTEPLMAPVMACPNDKPAARSSIPATDTIAKIRLNFIWSPPNKMHNAQLENF
jgi:hypothetical protein